MRRIRAASHLGPLFALLLAALVAGCAGTGDTNGSKAGIAD